MAYAIVKLMMWQTQLKNIFVQIRKISRKKNCNIKNKLWRYAVYAADIAHVPYHMNNAIAQNIISLNSPAQVESEQQHLKNWRRVTIFCHVMRATVNDTTQNNGPNPQCTYSLRLRIFMYSWLFLSVSYSRFSTSPWFPIFLFCRWNSLGMLFCMEAHKYFLEWTGIFLCNFFLEGGSEK